MLVTGDIQLRESFVAWLPCYAAWLKSDATPWQHWRHRLRLVFILGVYNRYVGLVQ